MSIANLIFILAFIHIAHICHLKKYHPQCQKIKANNRHAEKGTSAALIQSWLFFTWSDTHDPALAQYKDGLNNNFQNFFIFFL